MRGEVIALGELHDVTEHAAVLDMVTIDDAVGRGEVRRAARVQKYRARKRKISVHVGVDVDHVVRPLRDGKVDAGAVQREPAADVRVEGAQLGKAGAVRGRGGQWLEPQRLLRQGRAACGGDVPQRPRPKQCQRPQQQRRRQRKQPITPPRQFCRQQHYSSLLRRLHSSNMLPVPAASSMAP